MPNGRRAPPGGSGPISGSSDCSWAPWRSSSWRSTSSTGRWSGKRRRQRRSAREHGQAEPSERRIEPGIAAEAVEAVIDRHERHLIVVLGDRTLQVIERQIRLPELAANHREPDRRAPASGDELLPQPLGIVSAAVPAIPDREERDEKGGTADQRHA